MNNDSRQKPGSALRTERTLEKNYQSKTRIIKISNSKKGKKKLDKYKIIV